MATFKEIKQKFSGNKPTKIKDPIKPQSKDNNLELTEARYLLALIAKSDFSGKDIQIVYNVALKLQQIIENTLNTEDVTNNG